MTIKELRKLLHGASPDAEVYIGHPSGIAIEIGGVIHHNITPDGFESTQGVELQMRLASGKEKTDG